MRKTCFVFALLLLTVIALTPTMAIAATNQEAAISAYVKEKDKVADADCVIYLGVCVVAVKTEKFASKTEYDNFKSELEKEIIQKYEIGKVIVTRSPKAMHMIKNFSEMTDEQRDDALRKFIEGAGHPPIIQPK